MRARSRLYQSRVWQPKPVCSALKNETANKKTESKTSETHERFVHFFKIFFWLFIADFIILTWVGQKPVRDTYIFVGQIGTVYYFLFFFVLIPVVGIIESKLVHYNSTK